MAKESQIQKQVIDYLKLKGWFVFKNSSVGIFIKKTNSYIKAQTTGISDLTIIKSGDVYFVEIKRNSGVQSEGQKQFQVDIESHGGTYLIFRSIEDAIKFTELIDDNKKTL